jgi:L-iditol 2-dehydrogenase
MVFHGPGDLRYEKIPIPEPEPDGLVMKIDAALTCGTDVKTLRRGHPVMIPRVPTVFGHEFAGRVSAVGAGAARFREGDRVVAANSAPCGQCRSCARGRPNLCEDLLFVNGAYGEYIALPPRLVVANTVALPSGVPAARAAFAEPLACALLAIERADVQAGHTVLVLGPGPLGCLLAMVATARRARVIMVGHPGWRLERVRALRSWECLEAPPSVDVVAEVRARTEGRGADVTIDATGQPEGWEQAVDAVGRGGCVVFFGGCAPGTALRLDTRRVHYEELALLGAFHHTPATIRRAVALLESGSLVPDVLITHRMGLHAVPDALALMARSEALKVLIEP